MIFTQAFGIVTIGIGAVINWFQALFHNINLLGASTLLFTMILISLVVRFLLMPLIGSGLRMDSSDKVREIKDAHYQRDNPKRKIGF